MQPFVLHLYVSGQTPRSLQAAGNLQRVCEQHLGGNYELKLFDIQREPELAEAAGIFATPITIRMAPPPVLRVIGDLSDGAKVLRALGIEPPLVEPATEQG